MDLKFQPDMIRQVTTRREKTDYEIAQLNPIASCYNFEFPDFKYSYPSPVLSNEQRKFYDDNGFLLVKKLVPHTILDACCQRFVDLCNGRAPVGGMTLMKDISLAKTGAKGEFLYNKVQDIVYDEVFATYMFCPELLAYVEAFTGPNIMAVHSMLINKPPDAGTLSSRHPLHQDLHYFPFRPANHIVASWTAMERVTKDNGCLFVLPGTHKGPLLQHDYPDWNGAVNKMYHGVRGCDSKPKVEIEMEKGDTVFFHPLLIHGSGPNLTKGFRKAISVHFAASECEYINVKGTIQENIANEVEELMKTKGVPVDFIVRMNCMEIEKSLSSRFKIKFVILNERSNAHWIMNMETLYYEFAFQFY